MKFSTIKQLIYLLLNQFFSSLDSVELLLPVTYELLINLKNHRYYIMWF